MTAEQPYTTFRATTNFKNTLLTEEIEENLKHWMRWSFLKIGAWQDVLIPESGWDGGYFHLLNPSIDPSFEDLTVYETPRLDLVYESGVDFSGSNPIQISGVWINGSFYEPDDSTFGHYVDYENGRVIFDTPLSSGDQVEMNYSYRTVSVQVADESELWKEVQFGTLRVDDSHLSDKERGEWSAVPSIKRQQLPVIVLECVPRGTNKPYELGSGAHYVYRDVLAHILAENRHIRNRIADVLSFEEDHVIWLFNSDSITGSSDWPLDYRGSKNENGLNYPQIIDKYKWLRCSLQNTTIADVETRNRYLHEGTVRIKTETVFAID